MLKRAVAAQAERYQPRTILIEDKASGTQLIQELVREGLSAVKRYEPKMDKQMRLHSVAVMIENWLVYLPENAAGSPCTCRNSSPSPGEHDDQADPPRRRSTGSRTPDD